MCIYVHNFDTKDPHPMKLKISKEIKVGLLATVALTIVYVGFNFLKGKNFLSLNHNYCTVYENCSGLSTASPVFLNGVPVGRVRAIKILPDKGYSALVTFEVEKTVQLTDATKARLMNASLFGDKAIDLIIEPGNVLKTYATITGQVEQSFMNSITEDALPIVKNAQHIALLIIQFVEELKYNTDKISSIFSNLEHVTGQVKQIVYNKQGEFGDISKKVFEIVQMLADRENGISVLLAKFNRLLAGIEGGEAKELTSSISHILQHIAHILSKTEQGKNSLSGIVYDDSFYKHLDQTLVHLDQLINDLKRRPWRYVNFSLFGHSKRCKRDKKE